MKRETGGGNDRCVISASGYHPFGDFRNQKEAHVLCIVQQTSGTLDPFRHPTSESVMSRDDFQEQITRVEVSVLGLPDRRVGTVRRSRWDYELQHVRVNVLVDCRREGRRGASRGRDGNERDTFALDRAHEGRRRRSRVPRRRQNQRRLGGTIRTLECKITAEKRPYGSGKKTRAAHGKDHTVLDQPLLVLTAQRSMMRDLI